VANLEELVVSLVAETSGLRAEMANAAKATKDATSKMDDAIQSFSENSSKNVGFFETALATMSGFLAAEAVQAVLGFAKDGIQFMSSALMEGAEAAIAEENALKRLATSLALSGQYSADAITSLQSFSSEMENLTGISDDVVASNLAVLSSLTRLDAEGLKRAQSAAIDMSVALGMDLDGATRLVGKGIEGNVEAFKRYGIEIKEGATKAETMANVLTKLEQSFGGAGAEAAKTFGGALRNLNNAWGNLNEAIAVSITKNPVVIAMLNQITEIFRALTSGAENSQEALMMGLGKALIQVATILANTAAVVDLFVRTFIAGLQTIVMALNAVAGSVAWLADKLGIVEDSDPFSRLNETATALNDTIMGDSTLSKMSMALLDVRDAGVMALTEVKGAAALATEGLKNQKVAVEELTNAEKEQYTSFAQGLADKGAALDNYYAYENEMRQLNLEGELASLVEHNQNKWAVMEEDFAIRNELMAGQHQKEWEDLQIARENNLITETQYAQASLALKQKQALDVKKLENDKTKFQQAEEAARHQGYMQFLDGISVLQQSSSKELVAIGKAAAITKTTIDAYVAIQNALANVPFPANIAAAAGIGAVAFANVAKISGIGFNEGGTLVGGGANQDSVPATLTKGETVVTRDLTGKLEDFLNGNSGGGAGGQVTVVLELKDNLIEFIEAKILERQASNVSLLGQGVV